MAGYLREIHVTLNPVDFVLGVRVDARGAHNALASVLERQILALFNLYSSIKHYECHACVELRKHTRAQRSNGRRR